MVEDQLDVVGMNGGDTSVQQLDKALHPDGSNFTELLMKSRVNPKLQSDMDHIIGSAIKAGKINIGGVTGKLNSAEAHILAHTITQYSINGQSRNEFTRILSGAASMMSNPLRFMQGRRKRRYDQTDPNGVTP